MSDKSIPSLVSQGYIVEYANDESAEYRHIRFGEHAIPGAWCSNCDKPLMRIMEIDTQDPRLGMMEFPFSRLPLVYCYECSLCLGTLYYKVQHDSSISIIHFEESDWSSEEAYHEVPQRIPASGVKVRPLTPEEQEFIISGYQTMPTCWGPDEQAPEYLYLYGHSDQIGGFPFLDNNWSDYQFNCPRCEREMEFLATFCNSTQNTEMMLAEEDPQLVYAYCTHCHVVGTTHTNCM
jgi:hypothetical protein